MMMNDYDKVMVYLDQLASERKFFNDKTTPSLEATNQVLAAMGRPDQKPAYRVVIGGTAGKGSVARYVEQTLLNEGKTVALLSSPHLQVVNERIRINGQIVSMKDFAESISYVKDLSEAHDIVLTYYEVIVVAGIYLAAQFAVEVLICEVGLGGEFDAVNAVQGPRIAAVTFIGDDHLEMFDNDMAKLAVAKAGIFTNESVLNLSYEQKYRSIFDKLSNSEVVYLKGIKPKMNKKIARNICEKILKSESFTMTTPKLPARWEKVNDELILDGAHSGPRFEYILPKIAKYKPTTAILGMSQNHDPQKLEMILSHFDQIIWTEFPGSIPATDLQSLHKVGEIEPDLGKALKKATGKTLVTGSLYLCGHVREQFYVSADILDQQTEFPV